MQGWKEKFLSHAGKEILLKAVVQAIPTYTVSVFQIPKTLCNEINLMISKFWWAHKGNEKKKRGVDELGKNGEGKENSLIGFP